MQAQVMFVDFSGTRIMTIQGVFYMHQNVGSINHFINRKGYGLVFVEYGQLDFLCNDTLYFSDNKHILYIPKGVSYVLSCSEKCQHYTINFDIAAGQHLFDEFYCYNMELTKNMVAMLNKFYICWELNRSTSDLTCMSRLYEILAHLNFSNSKTAYYPRKHFDSISPSVEFLEMHYADPSICNEVIAEVSGISTVYFRKLFTQHYGISPMRFVRQKRINKARNLIENGYTNITEIAESTGFNSIYHFSKAFKQIVGVSPANYAQAFVSGQFQPADIAGQNRYPASKNKNKELE